MNWGKGIVIGMALFMGFIITLVVIMMRQNIDLVREDYYQKEIEFDQQYNAEKTYVDTKDSILITVIDKSLEIKLGKSFQADSISIELKRPNNQKQDLTFRVLAQPVLSFPTEKLPKGTFECFIFGKTGGKDYQYKENIYIN